MRRQPLFTHPQQLVRKVVLSIWTSGRCCCSVRTVFQILWVKDLKMSTWQSILNSNRKGWRIEEIHFPPVSPSSMNHHWQKDNSILINKYINNPNVLNILFSLRGFCGGYRDPVDSRLCAFGLNCVHPHWTDISWTGFSSWQLWVQPTNLVFFQLLHSVQHINLTTAPLGIVGLSSQWDCIMIMLVAAKTKHQNKAKTEPVVFWVHDVQIGQLSLFIVCCFLF